MQNKKGLTGGALLYVKTTSNSVIQLQTQNCKKDKKIKVLVLLRSFFTVYQGSTEAFACVKKTLKV